MLGISADKMIGLFMIALGIVFLFEAIVTIRKTKKINSIKSLFGGLMAVFIGVFCFFGQW